MNGANESPLAFPCDYPIRVVGDTAPDFRDTVVAIAQRHAPALDPASVTVRDSRNGRFQSVALTVRATGEAQLRALTDDLKATGRVHAVL